jgi:hypothetical protein
MSARVNEYHHAYVTFRGYVIPKPYHVTSVYFMMPTVRENATDLATDHKAEMKPTSETGHTGGLPTSVSCRQCGYQRRYRQVPTGI